MSRMVVFGVSSPPQSWVHWHSILVLNISLQPISGTRQKLKLATMVLHAREADDLESPSSSPFLPKVASWKFQPQNNLNWYDHYGSPPGKEELKTQSCLIRTTILHLLRNRSLHSLAQALCCPNLKHLRFLAAWQAHILPSPWGFEHISILWSWSWNNFCIQKLLHMWLSRGIRLSVHNIGVEQFPVTAWTGHMSSHSY